MNEIRLVTFGRFSEQFRNYIHSIHPDIVVIVPTSERELKIEVPKANTFAGFNHLQHCNISQLEWIHSFGAGVDSFLALNDLKETTLLSKTTGNLSVKIGEYCLTYILNEMKNVLPTFKNQKKIKWIQQRQGNLSEQKILIIGTGYIGKGIASILKNLCNEVSGMNKSQDHPQVFDYIYSNQQLTEIKNRKYDILINTLPSTRETINFLTLPFLENFDNIHFINVGRGDVILSDILIEAIDRKYIRIATLDVFVEEPLPNTSPLWKSKNINITPHQAGLTSIDDIISSFEKSFISLKKGEYNTSFINKSNGY